MASLSATPLRSVGGSSPEIHLTTIGQQPEQLADRVIKTLTALEIVSL
jgi:hypothetical protein